MFSWRNKKKYYMDILLSGAMNNYLEEGLNESEYIF